jgi:hypothetical protein
MSQTQVQTPFITNDAVTTAKIADSAVTTAKIADSAVTTAKIASPVAITGTLTGNASSATTFSTNRTNYKDVTDGAVAGQLMWKNYGNGHTIFDASNSTSPQGGAVNNTNSQIAWTGTYPTLMGWNGVNTYGVRVDSARRADSAASADSAIASNALGVGQSWQNLTSASRSNNAWYQNTTGRTIFVTVWGLGARMYVRTSPIASPSASNSDQIGGPSADSGQLDASYGPIPNGYYYYADNVSFGNNGWKELR